MTEKGSKEVQLFYSIVRNLSSESDIDWQKVAEENNYKDLNNAKTMYRRFRQKALERYAASSSAGDDSTTVKASVEKVPATKVAAKKPADAPRKTKNKADRDEGEGNTKEDDEKASTPAPKKRKRSKTKDASEEVQSG